MTEGQELPIHVRGAADKLHTDELTVRVVRSFQTQGIDSILLKGPALARWLYQDGQPRFYVDTDLLVAPASIPQAEKALRGLGLLPRTDHQLEELPGDQPLWAFSWIDRGSARSVDLHRTLNGVGTAPSAAWDVLWRERDKMSLQGETIVVLNEPARTLHVALHAAQDGGRVARAMEDLRRAIELVPQSIWRRAVELARELEAVDAMTFGLRLNESGALLADRLELPAQASPKVLLRARAAPSAAGSLEWLFTRGGWASKLALARRKLFPPPDFMRVWSPLARRGPVGLALSYVWRPLWLSLKAAPGLLWLIWARRASARSRSR